MVDYIFREYDIRGKIGSELLINEVYGIAQAIAYYFKSKNPQLKRLVVGADGRLHSPELKQEVCRALQDAGIDVIFAGICPTPVVYFSLFTLPVDGGLMITASHNGPAYNGIKICLGNESVWGSEIQEIKKLVYQGVRLMAPVRGAYQEQSIIDQYIDWLVDHFPDLKGYRIRALIDCANAAGGTVLPQLIEKMGWPNVKLLYPEVDGTYPHHEADPTVMENMLDLKAHLATGEYEVGLGLDGDCDRMNPMTIEGELVAGDKMLALYSKSILEKYPGGAVVFDVKCSEGLAALITQWGGEPIMSPSGHSIIKNSMKKHHALLAGELSCHFFFNDRYFGYDDGIYAILRLFELLFETRTSLSQLLKIFPKKYSTIELRIPVTEASKYTIVEKIKDELRLQDGVNMITIDGIRLILPYGWAIIRASNTQPVICLRMEGNSVDELHRLKQDLYTLLAKYIDSQLVYTYIFNTSD